MSKKIQNISGSWSAAPTPLTKSLTIDGSSVKRMVRHHIRLQQNGMFIGGTCGEGPFLRRQEFRRLTSLVTECNSGKMLIAVQVTDNSYMKVVENIKAAREDGADIVLIAEPWFSSCVTEDVILKYYLESAEKSQLPVGIYSRGGKEVPVELYRKILIHPNVCMFKDSSCNERIKSIAIDACTVNRSLKLLTGYELGMVPYLLAGYDGVLAGGGILVGYLTNQMISAAKQNQWTKVEKLQKHCNHINLTVYGGRKIASWLTGLKYTLVKMGIFKETTGYLNYPLPDTVKKKIDMMLINEKDVLLP